MKRFLNIISYIFRFRPVIITAAFGVLFAILVVHVFRIQIIDGAQYQESLSTSIEKEVRTPASRGRIFDRDGNLLAYDELTYAVNISDSGIYTNNKQKNETVNKTIIDTLRIIKEHGDTYSNDFNLGYEEGRGFYYKVEGDSLLRFLRDCYGVATVDELSEEEKKTSAEGLAQHLIDNYMIEMDQLTPEELIELFYLRVNMTANSYSRYRSFTIANEINDETMAAILESSNSLTGVTVDENYVRRYNEAKYYSGIIGYTGMVSTDQLAELQKRNPDYDLNDVVGKGGVEESFEETLAGHKGVKKVYLDNVGHITEVLSSTESVAGHDVYLTIDTDLQKKLYEVIEDKLTDIIIEYLRDSGPKFEYTAEGVMDKIYILMPEVYAALINNNLISLSELNNPDSDLEKSVHASFEEGQKEVLDWLSDEIKGEGTPYEELDDAGKEYVWRAFELLMSSGVIDSSVLYLENETVEEWSNGGSLKFKDFIKYCISEGKVSFGFFSDDAYADTEDLYNAIADHTIELVKADRTFIIDIYKRLCEEGTISGVQICSLLYDQGYLSKDDQLYAALSSGNMTGRGFIESALKAKILTPGELGIHPSSGGGIVTDPYTGELLACVSYPGYDNNRITGDMDTSYYAGLQFNQAAPMLNWATQAKCAPGSIFKLCTAITALDTEVADAYTDVYCEGLYTDIVPSPRCWVFPDMHGTETMATAIRDSCNVFFYTMGNRIASSRDGVYDSDYGTTKLAEYASRLGLATKSGIEIPEADPKTSDTNAIASAIGQGTASFSCVNIARYVSTIVTDGECRNSNLIMKVTDHDGNVITEHKDEVVSVMEEVEDKHWQTVKYGMLLATDTYPALEGDPYGIACKTGTSQPSIYEPDNATFVSFAPYDDPEITLSIEIPFGYTSIYNTEMAQVFYKYYFDEYKNGGSGQ